MAGSRSSAIRMCSPSVRRSSPSVPRASRVRSVLAVAGVRGRLTARSWVTSFAARSVASRISRVSVRSSSGSTRSSRMLAEPGDDRQQVVEVVSDAAGQAPDHLELLRLSEGLLEAPALGPGGLLLRHVLAHARQQQPLAVLAHDRKSAGAHPAQLSVRSQDAQLLIEARRVGPALETRVEAPAVVGVDRVGPGVRALVEGFRRAAPDAFVGPVDEHRPKRLGLGDADGVIEVLEHLAKALLAHVERGLRGHAVGHVLRERGDPSGAARGDQLERLVIDPADATVAALDAVVDRLGPLALGDQRPVVRMDGLEQSRGRLAGEVRARPSPKQVEGGAQIDDLAGVRVLEPEHLTDPPGELADRVPGAAQSILGALGHIELIAAARAGSGAARAGRSPGGPGPAARAAGALSGRAARCRARTASRGCGRSSSRAGCPRRSGRRDHRSRAGGG